jgi:hypothetical protein
MSDISTQVDSQPAEDVPPLWPCEVVVSDLSERPFLAHRFVMQWVWGERPDGTFGSVDRLVPTQSTTTFVDENGDELIVHQSEIDDECLWCNNGVIHAHRNLRARNFARNGFDLCNYCASSADSCDRCSGPMTEDYSWTVGDYDWCESCYDNYATRCEYCDEVIEYGDECDCDESGGDLIQSYSTKFSPLFLHDYNVETDDVVLVRNYTRDPQFANKIAMGLEFEMENMCGSQRTGEIARIFADAYNDNHLMLKHDGSISNGFELVTQPHTLDAFMQAFDWDLIREAQRAGMRGWEVGNREIGIHIHINRKAFYTKPDHTRYNASPHLMAFMTFIYSNVKAITRIAGRNVHYGHMSQRYLQEAYNCCKHGYNQYSRTQAINLMNDATVELRMFRSTMRVERVQAYLQFAEAAVRYTQTNRIEKMRDRFHFAHFAKWVEVHGERYQQLHNLIVETRAVEYAIDQRPIIQIAGNYPMLGDDTTEEFVPSTPNDYQF